MAPVSTTVRLDLASQAQTLLLSSSLVDDTFEIVPGKLEGRQADKDRGSVWVEAIEPGPEKALEIVELHLRVFKRFYASRGADVKPYDPSPLEAVAEVIQTAFNGAATAISGLGGYYEIVRQEFLIEEQGLEVTILAFNHNLFKPAS